MRMGLVALAIVLAFAGCKDKDKQVARDMAETVKDKTVEVGGNVKDKLGEAKDKVVEVGGDVLDKALEKGKAAKTELDKAYKTEKDYELSIEEPDSATAAAHAARLDKMPSVEIKGVRIGYEEDNQLSLRGTTYMKHFRASWKRGDKIVRVSFYTKETIDVVEFAKLLAKLVPAVETVLR